MEDDEYTGDDHFFANYGEDVYDLPEEDRVSLSEAAHVIA